MDPPRRIRHLQTLENPSMHGCWWFLPARWIWSPSSGSTAYPLIGPSQAPSSGFRNCTSCLRPPRGLHILLLPVEQSSCLASLPATSSRFANRKAGPTMISPPVHGPLNPPSRHMNRLRRVRQVGRAPCIAAVTPAASEQGKSGNSASMLIKRRGPQALTTSPYTWSNEHGFVKSRGRTCPCYLSYLHQRAS